MSGALRSNPWESAKVVVAMSRVVLLVLVVLIASLGGRFLLPGSLGSGGAALASEGGGHGQEGDGHGKKDEGGHGKKGGDESASLVVENLTIPVIRHQRVERHVTLSFSLEPANVDARHKIYEAMPRLRNAYVMDLMAYLRVVDLDGEPPAIDAIRSRLMLVTERTIGAGVVKSLYFQRTGGRTL
ncbi:MAG: hypothetical protein U1F33_00580 [Alphaproteobacteria bacterium]